MTKQLFPAPAKRVRKPSKLYALIRKLTEQVRLLWSDNVALKAALKKARIERDNLKRLLGAKHAR